jgi:arsenical pump membrane protein
MTVLSWLHFGDSHNGALASTCVIAGVATGGVIVRPWGLPEAIWPIAGVAVLVLLGLLPPADVWHGVAKGVDVYLFLTGMMLLAELARSEGLFDWLAGHAARTARGSAVRLFNLVYLVGTLVTIVLSNDATAVVLTPAIAAVARTARAEDPLPYLFVCAFIANAASFVLPISNPANLVIYGRQMPSIAQWLPQYALAALLSIGATYVALRVSQRRALRQPLAADVARPELSSGGRATGVGILATAVALMLASSVDLPLGWPTCVAGVVTVAVVLIRSRTPPRMLREISWGVIPLVAGLFVLVEALGHVGVIRTLSDLLHAAAVDSSARTAWGAGTLIAVASNLVNNLPAGLIAGTAVQAAHAPASVTRAILIGVDLGPNLSVTGSLATILWLTALRRDGQHVSAWTFLKLGILVMPPALLLALGAVVLRI